MFKALVDILNFGVVFPEHKSFTNIKSTLNLLQHFKLFLTLFADHLKYSAKHIDASHHPLLTWIQIFLIGKLLFFNFDSYGGRSLVFPLVECQFKDLDILTLDQSRHVQLLCNFFSFWSLVIADGICVDFPFLEELIFLLVYY